ncbi:carbohydrate kinase family protein [Candidatus Woesearchaeota archaeon]|nr:carbohydrate kinase family protein [Candidatus Woesearchaeota archaeon]
MFDVITVGSATVDVFVDTESELIKIRTPKHLEELIAYPSGSKILIRDIIFMTGGGGTNTAVSFARLGLKTAYFGKMGDDDNGKRILTELKKEKIEFVGYVSKKKEDRTAYSIILDSIEHDRTILAYKGCMNSFSMEHTDRKKLKAKWFYFSSLVGDAFKTQEKLAEFAKKNGIKVAFNPSNYQAEKGPLFLSRVLRNTEVLILNDEEAGLLVRGSIKEMLVKLSRLGPKIVVITKGKKGSEAYDGKYHYDLKARKIKVVETTGAGDCFASTFIAMLIKGRDVKSAMKLAQINSESVIQYKGAKNNLLSYKKLINSSRKTKISIKKSILNQKM